MKSVLAVLLLVVAGAFANDTLEGFLSAQSDLSLVHEFSETILADNRQFLSDNLYILNRQLIESHLDAYGVIKNLSLATDDILAGLETNDDNLACVERVQRR